MSYLVLARKFRPQTFASIVGQEHISKALQNAVLRNRIPHALIFTGPRGVGKTTTARIIAKILNCQKITPEYIANAKAEDIEPCGECASCKSIANSSSIAVWEIDGASNNSVDNVRSLIDSLLLAPPPGARYKVYIIDEVHMLSTAAFNALLKSLEEPPPNTVFVFATTDIHKVPETVISRCQRHDFTRIHAASIENSLREIAALEKIEVSNDVLSLIAKKSAGGMRDAQSMFDRLLAFSAEKIDLALTRKIFGFVDHSLLHSLVQAIIDKNSKTCFEIINDIFSQSLELRSFCGDLVLFWRNLYLVTDVLDKQPNPTNICTMLGISQDEYSSFLELAKKVTRLDCLNYFEKIMAVADKAIQSNYPRYIIEAGLIKIINSGSVKELAEVVSMLEELKKKPNLLAGLTVQPTPQASKPHHPPQAQSLEQGLAQKIEVSITESREESAQFVPVWGDFLAFAKSKSALMLISMLKRVVPELFELKHLKLKGPAFEIGALEEKPALANLKQLLAQYSGCDNWLVELSVTSESEKPSSGRYVAGSVADKEQQSRIMHEQKIKNEVTADENLKNILNIFPDSKIEHISVIRK